MKPVHLRTVPPPQETFQHTELFKLIFQFMKPYSYLELGVRWGGNLKELAPYCKQAVGVDFAYSLVNLKINQLIFFLLMLIIHLNNH